MGLLLLLVLIVALAGVSPAWPYSRTWGFAPVSGVGLVLLLVLLLLLLGTIPLHEPVFVAPARPVVMP